MDAGTITAVGGAIAGVVTALAKLVAVLRTRRERRLCDCPNCAPEPAGV